MTGSGMQQCLCHHHKWTVYSPKKKQKKSGFVSSSDIPGSDNGSISTAAPSEVQFDGSKKQEMAVDA